uniref:MAGUK p55 subfamily member 7 n=1 Tax=Phallusia mammillata TaxID=59560 RepID=A0A6F9DLC3_9ASCI|nr:MAGUK p55 subfamily member 7 [Phallusia mammillata]
MPTMDTTEPAQCSTPNIVDVVNQLRNRIKENIEDLQNIESLDSIIQNPSWQALIEVHEKFQEENHDKQPANENSLKLVKEVLELSRVFSDTEILTALAESLRSSPHLLALLSCHDKVAIKDYGEPNLSESTEELASNDEKGGEESMKVVRLVKADEPLGATIARDDLSGKIIIARILKGGAADRSGLIHVNDIIVEVNGIAADGKKPEELIRMLAGFRGPLTFKLIPGEIATESNEETMYLRSNFTFTANSDPLIPCKEAGLNFKPGDILKVVSKDDNSWWQAEKVGTNLHTEEMNSLRAGLIPSVKLQTRREKLKKLATLKLNDSPSMKGSNTSLLSNHRKTAWSVIRASFRRKRSGTLNQTMQTKSSSQLEEPSYPAYEVVTELTPSHESENGVEGQRYRPIVLVGPQGVGRNELKDRLIDSNPAHYGVPVPHTSRPKQPDEVDGRDYHFVTREFMEAGIRENLFLEYGEYRGNLYGTSLEAVREVMKNLQVCVLTPYPQALRILRKKEFKPYVIFIKPPTEELMTLLSGRDAGDVTGQNESPGKLTLERNSTLPYSPEELKGLVRRGEKMEQNYGRLFDHCIVNDNIDRSFEELKEVSFSVENDLQWVPVDWAS